MDISKELAKLATSNKNRFQQDLPTPSVRGTYKNILSITSPRVVNKIPNDAMASDILANPDKYAAAHQDDMKEVVSRFGEAVSILRSCAFCIFRAPNIPDHILDNKTWHAPNNAFLICTDAVYGADGLSMVFELHSEVRFINVHVINEARAVHISPNSKPSLVLSNGTFAPLKHIRRYIRPK